MTGICVAQRDVWASTVIQFSFRLVVESFGIGIARCKSTAHTHYALVPFFGELALAKFNLESHEKKEIT